MDRSTIDLTHRDSKLKLNSSHRSYFKSSFDQTVKHYKKMDKSNNDPRAGDFANDTKGSDIGTQDKTNSFSETVDLSLPQRKKKRKPGRIIFEREVTNKDKSCDSGENRQSECEAEDGGDLHTYQELLTRLMRLKHGAAAAEAVEYQRDATKKLCLPPPWVYKFGTRRTAFINFWEICQCIKRRPTTLKTFLEQELGCPCSVDGSKRLILRGIFKPIHMERVLRNFLKLYVFCPACKSSQTILQRKERLTFLTCDVCEAFSTVPPLK